MSTWYAVGLAVVSLVIVLGVGLLILQENPELPEGTDGGIDTTVSVTAHVQRLLFVIIFAGFVLWFTNDTNDDDEVIGGE